MDSLQHILSPANATWVGWTMFALLFFAILAENVQRGIISQAPHLLVAQSDRVYKESPSNFGAQVVLTLFHLGTISMAICLCFYSGESFRFLAFIAILGIIVGVLVVKMLCQALLDYTFTLSRNFHGVYEQYSNVLTLVSVILYPVLLVLLRVANPVAARWALGIIAALFLLLWLYRGGRIFIQSPTALLYFTLYICTLELLPMAALYYLSGLTMTII